MKLLGSALLSIAVAAGAAPPVALGAPAGATGERVVDRERVVVRVSAGPGSRSYDYVVVDRQDGDPVLLDTLLADRGHLGVGLLDLTPELRRHFGAPEEAGVMISAIEPESPAAAAGLRAGDILTAIDGQPVAAATTATRIVSEGEAGQTLELGILRDRKARTIAATLTTRPRKQIDLGGLLRMPDHRGATGRPELRHHSLPRVELDPESMDRALGLMRQHFESREWREQLERAGGDRQGLERRIRELEQRLEELERQLRELPD